MRLWNIESENDTRNFAELIDKSEQRRYKSPIIDVSENRVYIPEARVYLPLNGVTRDLRYDYFNVPASKALYLSTVSTVGAQITEDDHQCDKVVSIQQTVVPMADMYSSIGEIEPTKDGLHYMYAHTKEKCSIYFGTVREDLIAAARQMKSY